MAKRNEHKNQRRIAREGKDAQRIAFSGYDDSRAIAEIANTPAHSPARKQALSRMLAGWAQQEESSRGY